MTTATKTAAAKPVSPMIALTAEYVELARLTNTTTPAPKSKAKIEAAIATMKEALKAKTRRTTPANAISAADIARDMGINAKVARAKLRRVYATGDKSLPRRIDADKGWFFAKGDTDRVHELLAK